MRLRSIAAAGILGLAVWPARAVDKLEPPDLARYVRWGPLRVRPGIELADVGYDGNIFFNTAGRQESDYTATIAPQIEGLLLLGHRGFLTFHERLEYIAYVRNSGLNFLNQKGSARLTVPFRRFGLYTDLSLFRVQERPADREDLRTERREGGLGVGVIAQPGWRTEIEFGLTRNDLAYRDRDFDQSGSGSPIARALDRHETGVALAATYDLTGRTALLVEARERSIDFEDPANAKDSTGRTWLAGARLNPGGALSGTVRAGLTRIDAERSAVPDLRATVGDVKLIQRLAARSRLELTAQRAAGFSLYDLNPYYLQTTYGLRAVHYLNRLFGLEAGASLGRLSFPEAVSPIERRDRTRSVDGGVRLRLAENTLGRRVEYSLRVTRYARDSNLDIVDQTQTTVNVNAVLGF